MSDSEEDAEITGYSDSEPLTNLYEKYIDCEQPFICEPMCNGKIKSGCTGSCKQQLQCLCDKPGWNKSSCPLHSG